MQWEGRKEGRWGGGGSGGHTSLPVGGGLNPLVVLGVLLRPHCTCISTRSHAVQAHVVPAADAVNSRWWRCCWAWNWQAKGDCRRVADEVNWRAARTTEKRAAIVSDSAMCEGEEEEEEERRERFTSWLPAGGIGALKLVAI